MGIQPRNPQERRGRVNGDLPPDLRSAGILQRLYDRCMRWVGGPWGVWALFTLALSEAVFFPLPPDVFLLALCLATPQRSLYYAGLCAAGSVLGGALGYGLGLAFMDTLGMRIIEFYGFADKYVVVRDLYHQYDAWAVAIAGFTPLPYKLFTTTAGAFRIDFPTFILASACPAQPAFC